MTAVRYILTATNVLLWNGLAWWLWDTLKFYEAQHLVGIPALTEVQQYAVIPLAMALIGTLPPVLLWQTKAALIGTAWSICALLLFFLYALFIFASGV